MANRRREHEEEEGGITWFDEPPKDEKAEKQKARKLSSLLEGLYLTGRLVDWGQTRKIARNPENFSEKNRFLGEHPPQAKVDKYMAGLGAGHYLLSKAIPEDIAIPLQLASIAEVVAAIKNNKDIGLGINKKALAGGLLLTYLMAQSGKNNKEEDKSKLSPTMIDDKTPGLLFTKKF